MPLTGQDLLGSFAFGRESCLESRDLSPRRAGEARNERFVVPRCAKWMHVTVRCCVMSLDHFSGTEVPNYRKSTPPQVNMEPQNHWVVGENGPPAQLPC